MHVEGQDWPLDKVECVSEESGANPYDGAYRRHYIC